MKTLFRILQANEETFIRCLRELAFPFLESCENQEKGMRFHLLDQYLTALSNQDLAASLKVCQRFKTQDPNISLFSKKSGYNS